LAYKREGTLGVATADNISVRTMLIAALGCNLAWGIIDGGVYLLARLNERSRNRIKWRAVCETADIDVAHCMIADALPSELASALLPDQLESIRRRVHQLPEPSRPSLTNSDWLAALGYLPDQQA
jgi:hypothetical protein